MQKEGERRWIEEKGNPKPNHGPSSVYIRGEGVGKGRRWIEGSGNLVGGGVIRVAKYRARGRDQMRRRTREGSTERGQVTAPFIVRAHAVSGGAARLTEGQGEPACRGITETWSVSHVAR